MSDFTCDLDESSAPLIHHWERSIGSGHAALAVRADWQAQLARCHRDLGITHVRFHGMLSDDMGTVSKQGGEYSFFNADTVGDAIMGIGMHPLLELSFMPSALASGDTSTFAYQANVTPPADPAAWDGLIRRFLGHWLQRYGRDHLVQCPVEVWNEPNLPSFWPAGRDQYFRFYAHTARAAKEICPGLQVGGPVTAKGEWIREFQEFLAVDHAPCDFISTHYYPTDALGSASTDTIAELAASSPHAMRNRVQELRKQVHGLPLMLTEWNMTSNSRDTLHDQPVCAAYLVKSVLEMNGFVDVSSWWTFSDIFAESAYPRQAFHGGFGLLSMHGIPKPSYRAFQLLHELGDRLVPVQGQHATVDCWCALGRGRMDVVVTNLALPRHPVHREQLTIAIDHAAQPQRVALRRIDDTHANPQREWCEQGQPDQPSPSQLDRLLSASSLQDDELTWTWHQGLLTLSVALPANALAVITIACEGHPHRPSPPASSSPP